ncbi:MAG: hypothetical protein ACI9HE_000775 [Planctomycetota bacterium]|jgi:hypothetical protein
MSAKRTGASRINLCWGTRGSHGENGHVRGERGQMNGTQFGPAGELEKLSIDLAKPAPPPGVNASAHGGSHAYLTEEFITALLLDRSPLVDIAASLNMTFPGIVAHQSALKDGERRVVPRYQTI